MASLWSPGPQSMSVPQLPPLFIPAFPEAPGPGSAMTTATAVYAWSWEGSRGHACVICFPPVRSWEFCLLPWVSHITLYHSHPHFNFDFFFSGTGVFPLIVPFGPHESRPVVVASAATVQTCLPHSPKGRERWHSQTVFRRYNLSLELLAVLIGVIFLHFYL